MRPGKYGRHNDDRYNGHDNYNSRDSKRYSKQGKRGRYEEGRFSGNDNSYEGGSYSSRFGDHSSSRNRGRDEEGHFMDTDSRANRGKAGNSTKSKQPA